HAVPDYGAFADERRLSDREIATLGAWARDGAPEGDKRELPPAPSFGTGWQLGEPDLVLTMSKPYPVPASGKDIYRAFSLPAGLPEDKMIVAAEFQAGAPSVVHHCIMFIDGQEEGRKLNERAGGNGWPEFFTP